ncbi:hypothetical protein LSAT2_031498 [Lamellibrachia satsuma]|nr:hypothetical protein LSAT2_031498 [Lamellibrachia satsuma]
MESAEEKLAQLEEMVDTLKRNQQPVNVTVTAPPTRKLRMFSGRISELHYWIGEARRSGKQHLSIYLFGRETTIFDRPPGGTGPGRRKVRPK